MGGLWWTSRRHWRGQVDNILMEFYFSETNVSCQAWTWMAHFTDEDANYYPISRPPKYSLVILDMNIYICKNVYTRSNKNDIVKCMWK